jgi:hypothetical protein
MKTATIDAGLSDSPRQAAPPVPPQHREVWVGLAVFCICIFTHQKRFDGPTAVSRLDLLHSLIRGHVTIDDYHRNTNDKALFKGHYYSDKAPGTVAFALPAFAVASGVLACFGVPVDSPKGWLVTSWVANAGSNALLAALGAAAAFAWLRRWVPPRPALLTVLAVFLGAAPLPYSTMMFSHAMVVGLLAIALWAIDRPSFDPASARTSGGGLAWLRRHQWGLLGGAATGWAVASEYTAGAIAVSLFVWLCLKDRREVIPFLAGALPPLLLIPAYSLACLGTPFALPYSYEASFTTMKEGLYAIKWPDAETAFRLLFSPTRGLFFWTPFLALAWLGLPDLGRVSLKHCWLVYALPLLHIIIISGRVWDWTAGPTVGPRLLAPVLPLLLLPCAFGARRFPKLTWVLAGVSIAFTSVATLTDACAAGHIENPLLEFHLPMFLRGEFSPNLASVLGLPPFVAANFFYLVLVASVWWSWRNLPPEESAPVYAKYRPEEALGNPE